MGKLILFSVCTILLFGGCFGDKGPEKWTGFVFPDKDNTKRSLEITEFSSLDECRKASLEKIKELDLKKANYECGLNCIYNDGLKTKICEKMSK